MKELLKNKKVLVALLVLIAVVVFFVVYGITNNAKDDKKAEGTAAVATEAPKDAGEPAPENGDAPAAENNGGFRPFASAVPLCVAAHRHLRRELVPCARPHLRRRPRMRRSLLQGLPGLQRARLC